MRRELTNVFRSDIELLQRLIDLDLSHWLSGAEPGVVLDSDAKNAMGVPLRWHGSRPKSNC